MSGKRRFSLAMLSAAALLVLGCQPLVNVGGKGDTSGQHYIKLTISAPMQGRAISVAEYQVTELNIEVRDPNGEVVQTITWYPAEGAATHMVPVEKTGEYELTVTHLGEQNGESVEATETAAFTIGEMMITAIEVVPGKVGVLTIDGAQASDQWVIGTWATYVEDPDGGVTYYQELVFAGDGTWTVYVKNANDPGDPILLEDMSYRGTYVVDDDVVSITLREIWFGGEWHLDDPPVTVVGTRNGDVLTFPVDLDGDGEPDTTWRYTKQ